MIGYAALAPERFTRPAMLQSQATVFLVDDDVSVREALGALIQAAGWPVLSFASAQAFLDCARTSAPGCLVLDVALPDLNGLDVQNALSHARSDLPIIFITGHGTVPVSVRAMKAGAAEFLTKPVDADVLLAAIADAVERSDASIAAHESLERLQADYAQLTAREREVMSLITAGRLNKQAAGELGISEITVKAHRGQVMRKMRARSFAELVTMGSALGLIPDAPPRSHAGPTPLADPSEG